MTLLTSCLHTAGFQPIDLNDLVFPAAMYIDYVRVYQREGAPGIGCSPDDYPTEDYINKYELLLFYFDSGELTSGQPFECLLEPQSHDVEPSWILLPTQLAIQRLLDFLPVVLVLLSPATSYFLFFTDDTTCSDPQPQISSVRSYVTVPHHLHHTPRLYPRYPRSLHRPMTHTDPQARPHHSRIRDTATPYDIGPSSCCFISMPFRLFRAGNEVFPCYLEISFPQLHPRSQDSHTVPGHS